MSGRKHTYIYWQVNDPVTGLELTAGGQLGLRMGVWPL